MGRYIPPYLDRERSNIENSQNTTLFLISCFQYILSAIVLSIGPPFRQSITENRKSITKILLLHSLKHVVPFVITTVAAVLFSLYMLLDPSAGFAAFMQLTYLSIKFKIFVMVLAAGGFVCAYVAERSVFTWFSRLIGKVQALVFPQRRKKRKEYKLQLEKMRI